MPGSPDSSTNLPAPAFACCQRRCSRLQFLVPADERCHLRAQCLEATDSLSPSTTPRRLWCRKAGESLRPEIGEFEQATDLPTGRLVNDQRVGNS